MRPKHIFTGKPIIRIFTWGTVRATIPRHRFDKKRAIIMGAAIFSAIRNIWLLVLIRRYDRDGLREKPLGGTM
jgi:hypothetical protein